MTGQFQNIEQLLTQAVGLAFPSAVLCFGVTAKPTTIAVGEAKENTWFDIASLTKPLSTALLAMRLSEKRLLRLNQMVTPGVTSKQLLAHTAGFPACFSPDWLARSRLLLFPHSRLRRSLVELARSTFRAPPGRNAVYSDLGYIVLGDTLEYFGQGRLDQLLTTMLSPLDMPVQYWPISKTGQWYASESIAKTRRETPWREDLQGIVHDDVARAMLGVAGHAGLFARAGGVYRLCRALLDTYHDEQTPDRRALNLSSSTVRKFFLRPPNSPACTTFGLGFDHPDPLVPGKINRSSAGVLWPRTGVGHLGFTGCSFWMALKERVICVLLSNRVFFPTTAQAETAKAALRILRPTLHDAVFRLYIT